MNTAGSGLAYSTYLGGNGTTSGAGIAVDPSGYADVTGTTTSSPLMAGVAAFPTTSGALQSSFGGGSEDALLLGVAPNGTSLAYSSYLGGSSDDAGTGVAIDDFGQW